MGIVSTEQFALTGMLYPISVPKASGAESLVGFIDADGSVVVEPSYALGSSFLKAKPASSISMESRDSSTAPAIRPYPVGSKVFQTSRMGCAPISGFIDHSGRWFIEPQFLITTHFSEGRASASS